MYRWIRVIFNCSSDFHNYKRISLPSLRRAEGRAWTWARKESRLSDDASLGVDAVQRKEWFTSLQPSAPINNTMDHRRAHPPPSYKRRHPPYADLSRPRSRKLQFRARNRLVDGGLPDVTRFSRHEASRCTDSSDANASPSSYVLEIFPRPIRDHARLPGLLTLVSASLGEIAFARKRVYVRNRKSYRKPSLLTM